ASTVASRWLCSSARSCSSYPGPADRFDQRRLLMATQTVLGALALGLLTVTGAVQLWHVYVFAFLSGTAAAFDAPVRQTFAWERVGERDLHNAVALNSTSFNAARMIGPAVGGLIIAAVGTGWAFLINGISYLAPVIALVLVRTAELHRQPELLQPPGEIPPV